MDMYNAFKKSLLGLYCNDAKFMQELVEVCTYYEFYEGRPYRQEDELTDDTGQLWTVKDRDYRPTREIRNITKKLMKKQGRFMTSVQPTLNLSSTVLTDREQIDSKRAIIEEILDEGKFWNKFSKAFLDCTIGKRVLLCLQTDVDAQGMPLSDNPLKFRFYTMPEFTYMFDPNDCDKLVEVQIAYQDVETVGKIQQEQRWHKWTYDMREDGFCYCVYEIVDGNNNLAYMPTKNKEVEMNISTTFTDEQLSNNDDERIQDPGVPLRNEWNTGFTQIPCKVILNDGLTGDTRGHSDIKDLMDLANDYNKTVSDYRDALRFKMFEQPVFIDCDSSSVDGIKIAPNAIIDLKSDPSLGDGGSGKSTAQFGMLSSTFNFQSAADSYLTRLKQDMYELMEQPLPENLTNVPSGKALKMLYYDLITRCEEKWSEWDEALIWLVKIIEEAVATFNLYSDKPEIGTMALETTTQWIHNYPIPDDELDNKQAGIAEVTAGVRSKKSYIEEFSDCEDAEMEFQTILDEQGQVNEVNNAMLGLDAPVKGGKEEGKKEEKKDDKKKEDKKEDKE